MKFAAIQFIDCLSESIKDKNLLPIDGIPLWQHNAKMLVEEKAALDSANIRRNTIDKFYIITNYSANELDDFEFYDDVEFIPKSEFNVGKCPLSERVRDAVIYIKSKSDYDAYILLLGNSRCFRASLLDEMIELYSIISPSTNITGMLQVASIPMLSPYRAMSIDKSNDLNLVLGDYSTGEDRHDSESCSWFYTGGPMIMSNRVEIPDRQSNWDAERRYGTYFPYLGDRVFGYRTVPRDCMELDAPWQLAMMSNAYNDILYKAWGDILHKDRDEPMDDTVDE